MKQGKTQSMDELVELYLRQMGLTQRMKERDIIEMWPEVVGQMIASRTQSLYVSDNKLFVRFTSAVVKNEILMVKEGLIKALNDKAGEKVIADIMIS